MRKIIILALGFCWLAGLQGCGGGGADSGIVSLLRLSNGTVSTTLTVDAGQGDFVIIPFSSPTNTDISGSATYRLDISAQSPVVISKPATALKSTATPPRKTALPAAVLERASARAAFETTQDAQFRQALQRFQQRPAKSRPLSYSPPRRENFTNMITIFSPFSGEKNDPKTADLLASNSSAAIYLDSRDAGSMSAGDGQAVLDSFSNTTAPRVHKLVGTEGDINGDGGVVIFVSSMMPSNVLGFFRPLDMLPDGVDPGTSSNEQEIVFTALPQTTGGDDLFNATLAHEYFHLVNFAIKSRPSFMASGGTTIVLEELALNEGQAHCIEDLVGWGGGDTYAVAAQFLNNVSLASIAGSVHSDLHTSVSSPDDTLARRGGMMLFLRYLFEQEGGATYATTGAGDINGGGVTFFRALTTSALVGVPNIAAAAGVNFPDIFGRWTAALYLDGTDITDDTRYNYQAIVTDSFTNNPRGFNLRGSRSINGGAVVTLNGPQIIATLSNGPTAATSSDGTVFLSGAGFVFLHTATNSTTSLSYRTDASSTPGLAIIKLP